MARYDFEDRMNYEHVEERMNRLGLQADDIIMLEALGYALEMNMDGCGVALYHYDRARAQTQGMQAAKHLLRLYDEYMEGLLVNGRTKEEVESCMSWAVQNILRKELTVF